MELRELGDRLFRLHAKLIIAVLLVGVLGGLAVHLRSTRQYQAGALFVMGAQDPQNAENAAVLADTARGIATGPQLVARAISQAGAVRSEKAVAAVVNVQTMGSSGILQLSVTDNDPRVAVRLANALVGDVVSTRVGLIQNAVVSSLRNLRQQQAATDAQIAKLSTRTDRLAAHIAASQPPTSGQNPAIAQLNALQARLTSLQDLANQIAVQRNELAAQLGPKTTVIDKALSATPVPGRELDDALLGAVLGLVAGIVIAASMEMLRPSLVGATAISRAIGAPLLGEMVTPPDSWVLSSLPDAGTYIELAADSQQVVEVRFAALDLNGRHRARVRMLEGPLHRLRFHSPFAADTAVTATGDGASIEVVSAEVAPLAASPPSAGLDGSGPPRTGLVVAVPRVLRTADLDALSNFTWISGWTLLGVLVYSVPRKALKMIRFGHGSAPSQPGSQVDAQVEVNA